MLVDREGFREKTQPQDGVGRTSAKNKPKSILLRQAESSGKMQKWFVSLSSLFKSPYKVFCMSVLAGKKKKKKDETHQGMWLAQTLCGGDLEFRLSTE